MPEDTIEATVFLVDDDEAVSGSLKRLIESAGLTVRTFDRAESFLADYAGDPGCLVLDVRMPGISGLELQDRLAALELSIPIIFISGHGDVPMASRTLRKGAIDFIEKPFGEEVLLDRIEQALTRDSELRNLRRLRSSQAQRLEPLTGREREVLDFLVQGRMVKEIALDLGLSPKTVQVHRANILEKTGARSVVELTRIAFIAGHQSREGEPVRAIQRPGP